MKNAANARRIAIAYGTTSRRRRRVACRARLDQIEADVNAIIAQRKKTHPGLHKLGTDRWDQHSGLKKGQQVSFEFVERKPGDVNALRERLSTEKLSDRVARALKAMGA